VVITVPKFAGKLGKSFCKTLKRDNTFKANLDTLGSTIWKQCDGIKTVKEILDVVTREFPHEKNIDQRLFLFLQQLRALGYIVY
jgi:Coenzyme PQQ synthesis protein D (PqqD)